jgi:hypothetical protein
VAIGEGWCGTRERAHAVIAPDRDRMVGESAVEPKTQIRNERRSYRWRGSGPSRMQNRLGPPLIGQPQKTWLCCLLVKIFWLPKGLGKGSLERQTLMFQLNNEPTYLYTIQEISCGGHALRGG